MVSAAMGRKLDLSGLTDTEAEHVLQVVQRDMRLRKKEEERLSDLRQELDDEGSRCLLLSRQSCFNQRCCIRCCSPFTFLLNPKRQCRDCCYNVCKACRVFSKRDNAWLCSACQKRRLLKTQSLEWFYTNVKSRFKRFGSAKVLKTLYRKHLAEHSALSELTEGSGCEESICTEGSVCGSDSTFYRQAEEHSMADTLTVAMRVAEEAIDEAISKAEFNTSTQDSEAQYLRQHRGELIEELAKTIVEKIMSRRKILAEMRADYDPDRTFERITDPHHHHYQAWDQLPVKQHSNLWRSRSAFSLLENELPGTIQDPPPTLTEGSRSGMTAWLSADCLDNVGVSSVLKSPDGNWIALQSASLSRPSMLSTKRGHVFNTMEKDSTVRSAYEGLDSDNDSQPEPDSSWGAVLHEIHRKLTDSNLNLRGAGSKASSPSALGNKDPVFDCEGNWKPNKPLMAALKLKVPAEIRKPLCSRRTSIIDVNFNVEGAGEDEIVDFEELGAERIRSLAKQKDPRSQDLLYLQPAYTETQDPMTSAATTPERLESEGEAADTEEEASHVDALLGVTQLLKQGAVSSCTKIEDLQVVSHVGDDKEDRTGEGSQGSTEGDEDEGMLCSMETAVDEGGNELDEEMRERLYRLVTQSRLAYFSSTDDELNKEAEDGEGEDRSPDRKVDDGRLHQEDHSTGLTYQLRQLEKQVGASQYSSTEDELDRAGVESEREDREHDIELAVKVCRLAYQVNATQFSSTEDELDRAGRGDDDEEAMDEGSLWKLRTEKTTHEVQLRDLASLVSASQFSSTEDELDRVNEEEAELVQEKGAAGSSVEMEETWHDTMQRRESIGDIDVDMFDLREESEGGKEESSGEDDWQRNQSEKSVNGNITREDPQEELLKLDHSGKETYGQQEAEDEVGHEESDLICIRGHKAAESDNEGSEFDGIMSSMLMMNQEVTPTAQRTEQQQDVIHQDGLMGVALDYCEVPAKDKSPESASQLSPAECGSGGSVPVSNEGVQTHQQTCSTLAGKCLTGTRSLKLNQEDKTCEDQERVEASPSVPHMEQSTTLPLQECLPSPEEIQSKYSAVSLRSITTEVLKMLNATEELLQSVDSRKASQPSTSALPPGVDPKKLDQQFSKLEEHVYVAAGSVYNLEEELSGLEEYARSIHTTTPDLELSFLEEQVAAAAAKVQQSEMKISDISLRIAALKSAGLNVAPQRRVNKSKSSKAMSSTVDTSKQMRRRLPAPPVKDKEP